MLRLSDENEMFNEVDVEENYPKEALLGYQDFDIRHHSLNKIIDQSTVYFFKVWLENHKIPSYADRGSERQMQHTLTDIFRLGQRRGFTVVGKDDLVYIVDGTDLRKLNIKKIDLNIVNKKYDEEVEINLP